MRKYVPNNLAMFLLCLNLFFGIVWAIVGYANNEKINHHKTNPQDPDNSWSGKYRQVTGEHALSIEQYEPDAISVEIVKVHSPKSHPTAKFLATIKNDTAFMTLLRKDPDCQMELKQTKKEGIIILDFCGGSGADTGLYIKMKMPQ